ncbi:MAG: LysR substrate-binding domain-containing protein [Myxococcota bacterium]
MKLRHLETFLVVAEELHFGRAATRLRVAQPAVSQTISALEDELGIKLFDRTSRRVRLTAAGRAYVDEVAGVFRQLEVAASVARDAAAGVRGRLAIAFTAVCTLGRLPDVIVSFMDEFPDIGVHLQQLGTADQMKALEHGTIDVGFSILPGDHGPVHSRLVAPDELHVYFASEHRLADAERVPIAEILSEPFLLMSKEREPCVHQTFEHLCERYGQRAEVVLELDYLESMFAFVAAGLGVSLAPSVAARLQLDGVTSRPLEPAIPSGISAIWVPETATPATRRFLDHLGGQPAIR